MNSMYARNVLLAALLLLSGQALALANAFSAS